jgi:hypothetical protein
MPTTCTHLPASPPPLRLSLPGGASLLDAEPLRLAQPALAPLQPFFQLLDAFLAVVRVLEAIPAAFAVPPDPTAIVARLAELGPKVAALLDLAPQLAVPVTVASVLDAGLDLLAQATLRIDSLEATAARAAVAAARAAALTDAQLARFAACAQADTATATANLVRELSPLAGVLTLATSLLALVGGPPLPSLTALDGLPLADLRAGLATVTAALQAARAAIPLP